VLLLQRMQLRPALPVTRTAMAGACSACPFSSNKCSARGLMVSAFPCWWGAGGCHHAFCLQCLREYVSGKVEEREYPVCCPLPTCKQPIATAECCLVLTLEEQDVLGKVGRPVYIAAARFGNSTQLLSQRFSHEDHCANRAACVQLEAVRWRGSSCSGVPACSTAAIPVPCLAVHSKDFAALALT
jgi:hypothetical protein